MKTVSCKIDSNRTNFCYSTINIIVKILTLLILLNIQNIKLFAQGGTPCTNSIPTAVGGPLGLGTNVPLKLLHLEGWGNIGCTVNCSDPTIRLGYNSAIVQCAGNVPNYFGHLALTTTTNFNFYSTIPTLPAVGNPGDLVLQAETAKDILLTTRNATGKLRFATTPIAGGSDLERMTIWPNGKIIMNPLPNDAITPIGDFSIKLSEGLNTTQIPNIAFVGDGTTRLNPEICLYRTHGGYSTAHSWRIGNEYDGNHYMNLTFKSSTETVTPGGTDDINGTGTDKLQRLVEFQNNGSVVFSGPEVDPEFRNIGRPLGAGTRFYWERQKGAIRAGYAIGDQWDFDNIGMYSTAFGHDTKADGDYSVAMGENCHATGQSSVCIGLNSRSSEHAYSFGDQCHAYGHGSTSLGYHSFAAGGESRSIGSYTYASGDNSTTLGNYCATGTTEETQQWGYEGAFYIGDNYYDVSALYTDLNLQEEKVYHSNNKNQITFRFMGDYESPNIPCVRFITHRGKDMLAESPSTHIYEPIGALLYNDGHDWVITSDSNLKKNIQSVDINGILNNLRQVPVKTWEWVNDTLYKDSTMIIGNFTNRWMGPMAQDFYSKFPIGIPDSTKLCTSVMNAAMMASIQALANINDSLGFGQKSTWHKGGDSIIDGDYIGSKYCEPILMKVNGHEKVKIADGQISFKFNGNNIDTTESNSAYRFYSNDSLTTGVYMSPGESGWRIISDRNQKEDFQNVDENKILKSIGNIPVNTWIYKKAPSHIRYIGPMAQDMFNEFKLGGTDSLSINSIIFDGINFAGIKALIGKTDDLKYQIDNRVSIDQFNSYRDSVTNNNKEIIQELDSKLSKNDFEAFKDSISCYKDACKMINELKDKLNELQIRIDSLEAKLIQPPNDKNQSDEMQSINFYNDIILQQNIPNPFSETCQISYYIPTKYNGMAQLIIANENGSEIIQKHEICNGKPCQIIISSEYLKTGVYFYAIEINGKLVKSSKMMIIK